MRIAWASGIAGAAGALLAAGVAWGTFAQRLEHVEARVLPLDKRGQVLARIAATEARLERMNDRINAIEAAMRAEALDADALVDRGPRSY